MLLLCLSLGFTTPIPYRLEKKFEWRYFIWKITIAEADSATGMGEEPEKYKLQSKNATPTKKQQSITPDSGYYGLSDVTVAAIPDAYQDVSSVTAAASDVLTGKIFVASDGSVITGTMNYFVEGVKVA